MIYVSATEMQNKFASIIDKARREPVTVQKNGRDTIVMMAVEDYEKLSRQMVKEFQEFCSHVGKEAQKKGLTEQKLNQLLEGDNEDQEIRG